MANFSLGFKTQIINSDGQNPIRFYKLKENGNGYDLLGTHLDFTGDAATVGTNANVFSQADVIEIEGFARFEKDSVSKAIGALPVAAQKEQITLTFATNSISEQDQILLNLRLVATGPDSEFARWDAHFERTFKYFILARPGETAADLIERLEATILEEQEWDRPYFEVVSKTSNTIVISVTDPSLHISAFAEGALISTGAVSITPAITVKGYNGRNTWTQLKSYRIETPASLRPLESDIVRDGLPEKNAVYKSYTWEKTVEREDLKGQSVADGLVTGKYKFELYVKNTLTQFCLALSSWLNANVAHRIQYTANTANLALATPEVVTTVTTKAAAPFTTGLQ